MPRLRLLGPELVAATIAKARASTRRRANRDLHPTPNAPIQRFLNAIEPESYIRPHRHAADRFELVLALAGRATLLLFDDDGRVSEQALLTDSGARIVEVPGGAWHTIVSQASGTLLFEVKAGPYDPATDKEFAPWAPGEGDPAAADELARWRQLTEQA